MKLYVCSVKQGVFIKNETFSSRAYALIAETGEVLATHWCSSMSFAKGDLYENRPERKSELESRFGECQCLCLGEDDMTEEELLRRNHDFYAKYNEEKEDKQC